MSTPPKPDDVGYPSRDPVAAATLDVLMESPAEYLHGIDFKKGEALFVNLSEGDYFSTSFLDHRIHAQSRAAKALPLGLLLRMFNDPYVEAPVPTNLNFLMHVSHCGSTLVSRVLQHAGLHVLREPVVLKDLCRFGRAQAIGAQPPLPEPLYRQTLGAFERLASRAWRADQRVLVKPSSYVSAMTAELLRRMPAARTVHLSCRPEVFLATVLRRSTSVEEVQRALDRWHRRDPEILFGRDFDAGSLSNGEAAGLLYACNLAWMRRAETDGALRARTLAVDFDEFLDDPIAVSAAVLRHVAGGGATELTEAQGAAIRDVLGRNAKSTDSSYGALARQADLNQSFQDNRDEISRGLNLIESAL